ncbi:MAG: DotA/TraY family protein, partial [Alphaproteobacteria bacterium]|nr:DotA/TraY family protein [Alphaproteobacteria bacterium]
YDVYVEATEKLYDKLKESARNILCYIEPKDALGGERGVAREGKSDKNKVDPFCKVSKDSDNDPIKATITFYEDIRKGLAGVAKRYQGDGEGKGKFKELKERLATELGPYGWVMAGAYVSTIERIQAEMGQSIKIDSVAIMDGKDALQQGSFDIGDIERKAAPGTTGKNNTRDSVSKLRQKVTTDQEVFRSDYRVRWTNIAQEGEEGAVPTAELQCLGMIHLNQGNHEGTMLNYKGIFGIAAHRTDNIIDAFLGAVDTIASHMKVWLPTHDTSCTKFLRTESGLRPFELGLDFTQNATALQNLITFGHNNVNAGLQLVLLGGLLQVFGAAAGAAAAAASLASGLWAALSPFIFALGMMGSWIGGILQFVSMFFFMVGFSFAYILPLIPFTRFFFAVLIWVGQVIEAVIAIPVVALAHLNPDGEGFIPQQAKRAYYFLFSIFLRPIMTLFGLIIGLLIFMISAYFLTFAYGIAVSAVGGTAYGHYVLAKIVYSLIYAFLLLVSANKAFEMITHLPANAVSWMGGDNAPAADLGRVEHMTEHEQVVGALAINEGVKGVQQGTQGVVGAINKKTETIKGKGKPQSDAEIES